MLVALSLLMAGQQRAECADVESCRQAALEAAQQQAFETFHDLAWLAVQKGRRNDPELMLLLARAQSLSGRPGDALVMLRRLAEGGHAGAREAITSDDFQRVRALAGWADVESAIAAAGTTNAPAPTPLAPPAAAATKGRSVTPPPPPAALPTPPAKSEPLAPDARKPAQPGAPSKPEARASSKLTPTPPRSPPAPSSGENTIRLPVSTFEPVGLAYDSVSRRFLVGDRRQNKLVVADEVFKHVNDLIGAGSAGFGTLTAIEIDARRGDLWVASTGPNGTAAVHKLQLVSGRVLTRVDAPEDWGPISFNDIAMSNGDLMLIDGSGARLITLTSAAAFSRPVALGVPSPISLAQAGGRVYVAHPDGLSVVDLKSQQVAPVRAAEGVTLTGLRRIRWYQGSLIAIQTGPGHDVGRLVRIRIAQSGTRASRLDALDDSAAADGSVLTIVGKSAYYLARAADGDTLRRVPLP